MQTVITIEQELGSRGLQSIEEILSELGVKMHNVSLTKEKRMYKISNCKLAEEKEIYKSSGLKFILMRRRDNLYMRVEFVNLLQYESYDG